MYPCVFIYSLTNFQKLTFSCILALKPRAGRCEGIFDKRKIYVNLTLLGLLPTADKFYGQKAQKHILHSLGTHLLSACSSSNGIMKPGILIVYFTALILSTYTIDSFKKKKK